MKPPRLPDDHSPKAVREHLEKLNKAVSNISFGSSTPESGAVANPAAGAFNAIIDKDSNMEGNKFIVHFPVAANTDIVITHNLGRIPIGWITLRLTNQGLIYIGSTGPTPTNITLRSTVGDQIAILHFT